MREEISRAQHEASLAWPHERRIDTTGLTVEGSLRLAEAAIADGQAES